MQLIKTVSHEHLFDLKGADILVVKTLRNVEHAEEMLLPWCTSYML